MIYSYSLEEKPKSLLRNRRDEITTYLQVHRCVQICTPNARNAHLDITVLVWIFIHTSTNTLDLMYGSWNGYKLTRYFSQSLEKHTK